MELTDGIKHYLQAGVQTLQGSDRRLFMARTVRLLGAKGQRRAERVLGWNRGTIRKGLHELRTGITCLDAFSARGRKRSEEHLPQLFSCCRTSRRSWIASVKRTPRSERSGCTPG